MSTITTRTAEVPRVPWRLVGMAALLVLALAIGAVLIVGASPLGPSLPGSLIGTWKSDVSGGYITFRDDGTFLATLSREGTGEFESGTWAVEGSVLTMTPTSSKYCAGIVGSYELKVVDDGNRLQPSVVDDACQPRLEAWESGLKRIVASEP